MHTRISHCLYCKSALKGRIDKKFCDDQCRTSFNNRMNGNTTLMRNINIVLRRNRRLLESLWQHNGGRLRTSRKRLYEKGYNFSYCTHTYTNKAGITYTFCYEYGFLALDGDLLMLVKSAAQ